MAHSASHVKHATGGLDDLLSRLEAVKLTGPGQWIARCPGHDDRVASLCISTGDDGRTLLFCHAGCSAETVLAPIGLTMRDLFPPDARPALHHKSNGVAKRKPGRILETYSYTDALGHLVF